MSPSRSTARKAPAAAKKARKAERMARIHAASPTKVWVRTNHRPVRNSAALPRTIQRLRARSVYMCRMKSSMMTAMVAADIRVMYSRVQLKYT